MAFGARPAAETRGGSTIAREFLTNLRRMASNADAWRSWLLVGVAVAIVLIGAWTALRFFQPFEFGASDGPFDTAATRAELMARIAELDLELAALAARVGGEGSGAELHSTVTRLDARLESLVSRADDGSASFDAELTRLRRQLGTDPEGARNTLQALRQRLGEMVSRSGSGS